MTDAGDFVLTMVIGFIVATFLSIIGAVVVGLVVMTLVDDVTGVIAGIIVAIVIFTVIGIMTFQLTRDPKK